MVRRSGIWKSTSKGDQIYMARGAVLQEATKAAHPDWAIEIQSAHETFTLDAWADAAAEQMQAIELH
jgi:hypothetical protein